MAKNISSIALESATNPSIVFAVELDYNKNKEAIIGINGLLKTADGKVLCALTEFPENIVQPNAILATNTRHDRYAFTQEKYKIKLLAEIGHGSIKHIDDCRKNDPKHDVKFKLELTIRYLESNITVAHLFETDQTLKMTSASGMPTTVKVAAVGYDPDFSSSRINGWLLSGNNGPGFLNVHPRFDETEYRIPSNDWINDYVPKFGYGHYTVIEMLSEGELFEKSEKYLKDANNAFQRWDTKSVFANCRELGIFLDNYARNKYGANSFTYKERWGRAYSNFSNWASLDLHMEEVKQSYGDVDNKIEQSDAEHLILAARLLIKHLQEI